MILIIRKKADEETLKRVAEDLNGYIKVVVDANRNILAAGGEMHSDAEAMLIEDGSKRENLWGAGLDLETNEMDFDSMINIRPMQNKSREILDEKIRQDVEKITRRLLKE